MSCWVEFSRPQDLEPDGHVSLCLPNPVPTMGSLLSSKGPAWPRPPRASGGHCPMRTPSPQGSPSTTLPSFQCACFETPSPRRETGGAGVILLSWLKVQSHPRPALAAALHLVLQGPSPAPRLYVPLWRELRDPPASVPCQVPTPTSSAEPGQGSRLELLRQLPRVVRMGLDQDQPSGGTLYGGKTKAWRGEG